MKKLVVKLDLRDDKEKQKAMKVVSTLQGIDSLAIHMNERKMTVIGSVDPVDVVIKLRKFWKTTDIVSVGPAKEEKKKEEPKKEEAKKEEAKEEKKEEAKKEEAKEEKKEEGKKDEMKEPHERMIEALLCSYNPHTNTYYFMQNAEENPNSCSIM